MTDGSSALQILLAEDSPADVTLVREALKEHGLYYELKVIGDGAQAIAFLHTLDQDPNGRKLDLVLVDMHVPSRNGREILKALRSTANYAGTPVIVMSSSDSPQDREAAEKHAALYYFRKPSTLAEFLELGGIVRAVVAGTPVARDTR